MPTPANEENTELESDHTEEEVDANVSKRRKIGDIALPARPAPGKPAPKPAPKPTPKPTPRPKLKPKSSSSAPGPAGPSSTSFSFIAGSGLVNSGGDTSLETQITSRYGSQIKKTSDLRKITMFVTDIGGLTVPLALKAALEQCRGRLARFPLMNDGILNSDSMTAVQRFDAAEKVQKLQAYFKILFRIHATKLSKLLNVAPLIIQGEGRGKRRATAEIDRGVELIAAAKGIPLNDYLRKAVRYKRQLGQRYDQMIEKFGWAILALIPPNDHTEYVASFFTLTSLTDFRIFRMNAKLFDLSLQVLEQFKGGKLRQMMGLLRPQFNSMFLDNELPSARWEIEDRSENDITNEKNARRLLQAVC